MVTAPQMVGSRSPTGDAKWGHADMAGNVWEWVSEDSTAPLPVPCNDCSTPVSVHGIEPFFGGAFNRMDVQTFNYDGGSPTPGFRCAR
jgi:formylglycine-generating enzyme required for sulfatase activity